MAHGAKHYFGWRAKFIMSVLSKTHSIRHCLAEEHSLLQNFIHTHWAENHILAHDKSLLDFQHLHDDKQYYHFIIALDKTRQEIDAVLGFIPTQQYDTNLNTTDIWLALWKVRTDIQSPPGLGLALLNYLETEYQPHTIAAIGINQSVAKLYQRLGYTLGVLHQVYIANPDYSEYKLLTGNITHAPVTTETVSLMPISDVSVLDFDTFQTTPQKSLGYIKNRYFEHPYYVYQITAIVQSDQYIGAIVWRKIKVKHASCLRIVEVIGNPSQWSNLYPALLQLLQDENAEYIDSMVMPSELNTWLALGFKNVTNEITLPNYFEPFVPETISIQFAVKSNVPYCIYKGDSDQDRPNLKGS